MVTRDSNLSESNAGASSENRRRVWAIATAATILDVDSPPEWVVDYLLDSLSEYVTDEWHRGIREMVEHLRKSW
jgi:hypothetical protein